MPSFKTVLRLSLLLTAGTLSMPGQEVTSTMVGTVTDQGDSVVPRAALTATEVATGKIHETVSDGTGLFRFNDLPPGPYKLVVRAPGFKAYDLTGIELATAETRALGKIVLQ